MAKRSTKKGAARTKRGDKKAIASYEHEDKARTNNPPVGLVTPDTRLGRIHRARPVSP